MSPNLRPFSKELKRSDALPSASRSSQVEARVFRFQSLITAIHCAHAAANRCGRHECAGNARGSGRSERCTSLVGNLPHGLDKLQASEAAGPRVGRRRRFGSRNVCRRKHCKIGRGEGGGGEPMHCHFVRNLGVCLAAYFSAERKRLRVGASRTQAG